MRRKRRSTWLLLTTLCTFALVLAGCSAGHHSSSSRTSQTNARLLLRETPGSTSTATTGEKGTYLGKASGQDAWIGLSSTGKRFIAFVTDGSQDHPPTFAQWFRGSVNNNVADATANGKNGQDRLQAMLNGTQASGTVTLANGKSIPFTATAASSSTTPTPSSTATPSSGESAGLYRAERVINGEHYIAGWIVMPENASATPGTGVPGTPGTGAATPTGTASATETPTVTATETPTATATGTATPSTTTTTQASAIVNEKTFAVQSAPMLTSQDMSARQVSIPSLGTFNLVGCGTTLC